MFYAKFCRKRSCFVIVVMSILIHVIVSSLDPVVVEADSCSDILSQGVFDVVHVTDDSALGEAFRKWQCVVEVKDASEARSYGVGLGVPIFGVPVSLDASFSKEQRERWRKQHCSDADYALDKRRIRDELFLHANVEIVAAWKECTRNQKGLKCQLEGDDRRVRLRYRYDPINNVDAKTFPVVISVFQYGTRSDCQGLPAPGAQIGFADVTCLCSRELSPQGAVLKTGFVINLADGRGTCDVSLEGSQVRREPCKEFVGTTIYESDANIRAKRICLKEGSVIRVLHGRSLVVEADEISVEGSGALIDAPGDSGSIGAVGAPGNGGGDWEAHTDKDYHDANGDCSRPGHPDRGHQGGQGGRGGQGGNVVVRAIVKGTLQHNVRGGRGGPGGAPGRSRTHWRPGHRDGWTCPNDGPGLDGPPGPDGTYAYEPQNAGLENTPPPEARSSRR